jgi:hypothetical protein
MEPKETDQNKPSSTQTKINPDEKGIFIAGSDEPILTANLYLKKGLILLSLFVFPPFGWYIIGKDTRFHKWFEIMFFAYGVVTLLLFLPLSFFSLPNLAAIYRQLHLGFPVYHFIFMPLLDLLAVGCVALGWFLRKKRKAERFNHSLILLSQLYAFVFYVVLIITILTFGFAIVHIIPKLE